MPCIEPTQAADYLCQSHPLKLFQNGCILSKIESFYHTEIKLNIKMNLFSHCDASCTVLVGTTNDHSDEVK